MITSTVSKGSVHQMVKHVLKPGMTAVDGGAAIGELTATMRQCVGPTGTVIAIEPRDTVIAGEPNVVHRVALGQHAVPSVPLFLAGQPTNASLYMDNILPYQHAGIWQTPLVRLDDLVDHADLIKLDVQGSEMEALRGAPRLLQTCPAWILEVWPFGLMNAKCSLEDIWDLLTGSGLSPCNERGDAIRYEAVVDWVMRLRKPMQHLNWLCLR